MSKFRVGDKIRCIDEGKTGYYGTNINTGEVYEVIGHQVKGAVKIADTHGRYVGQGYSDERFVLVEAAKKVEPDWDNLQEGDKIDVSNNGYNPYTVQGKLGQAVCCIDTDGDIIWYKLDYLKDHAEFVQEVADDDITELTLEEVAALAGKDVSKIRIKD